MVPTAVPFGLAPPRSLWAKGTTGGPAVTAPRGKLQPLAERPKKLQPAAVLAPRAQLQPLAERPDEAKLQPLAEMPEPAATLSAPRAKLAASYAGIGLSPDGGTTWLLPRLVGEQRSRKFFFEK